MLSKPFLLRHPSCESNPTLEQHKERTVPVTRLAEQHKERTVPVARLGEQHKERTVPVTRLGEQQKERTVPVTRLKHFFIDKLCRIQFFQNEAPPHA
jgi:hypothetical protein